MRPTRLFMSFLAILGLFSARAQELDSLWRVWNDTTLPDTARMQAMDYITFDHYMFNKPDTAYILAGLVLDLAQRKGNKRYEAWALNAQGASLEERGDLPNALYRFQRSAAIMEESGDVRRLAIMCNNIGSVLSDLDEKAQAKIQFERSLELARSIGNEAAQAATLINYANLLRDEGDSTKALDMYELAAKMNDAPDRQRNRAIALFNAGIMLSRSGQNEEAAGKFRQAMSTADSIGDTDLIAMAYRGIGSLALRQGHNSEALANAQKSLDLAQKAGQAKETSESAHLIYSAYKAMGQPALALKAFELHVVMQDSVRKLDDRVEVVRSTFQQRMLADSLAHAGELTQLENLRTIERLRADRNRNRVWAMGAGAVLLLGGISVFFIGERRRRQARFERDAATLETQALRSQMNPHFIFNALNSISAYVQENAKDTAVSFLARFARLMRLVLENSRHSEVPLKDDLEALDAYLHLERVRCNEKFDYTINVDPAIDPEELMVPPLVAQPFVENAIWHGISGKEGKGHITLTISMRGDPGSGTGDLLIAIEDDGAGRNSKKVSGEIPDSAPRSGHFPGASGKKTSLGTAITQARLDLVGKQRGRPAGFRYVDLPQGTRVELTLPLSSAA